MSVTFRAIDDSNREAAATLLKEGFAKHGPAFWDDAVAAISDYAQAYQLGAIGTVMSVSDQPAGVLLTIPRRDADGCMTVNLSSWYVRQKYRWLAPRMLQSATADNSVIYTDLSASPETVKLNTLLGFRTVTAAVAYFFLPLTAFLGTGRTRIERYSERSAAALGADERDMLRFHADLGCICGVLHEGDVVSPIIFNRTSWRGIPFARLLHAGNRSDTPPLGAMARFLLGSGMFLLGLHANRGDALPTGWFRRHDAPVQVKGEWGGGRVDAAYSELAFLRL